MSGERNDFKVLLDDLVRQTGVKMLVSEQTGDCILELEGGAVEVNVSYRPATDLVVTSAVVAPFEPSVDDEARARVLLELNWQWRDSRGFTVAVDETTSSLIVADRRSATRFASATALGNYLADAAALVHELRQGLVELEDCVERASLDAVEAVAGESEAEEEADASANGREI